MRSFSVPFDALVFNLGFRSKALDRDEYALDVRLRRQMLVAAFETAEPLRLAAVPFGSIREELTMICLVSRE